MYRLLSRPPIDPYIAGILGMVGLASVIPAVGPGMVLASGTGTAMIALMFFLQGARLAPHVALAGAKHWRLHVLVLASTFLLFPAIGSRRARSPQVCSPRPCGQVC